MAIPRIDPNVKYKGTSYLRELNADTLRTLEGAIVITSADSSPLAVIVSMSTYLRMQEETQSGQGLAPRLTDAAPGETERRILREEQEALSNSPFDNRPKNATCRHCGERFAGQRFATICQSCKSSGHTLTPAECPVCNEARAI